MEHVGTTFSGFGLELEKLKTGHDCPATRLVIGGRIVVARIWNWRIWVNRVTPLCGYDLPHDKNHEQNDSSRWCPLR